MIDFILTSLRLGTPLSLAAMGGYCSERSGIINIGLEGMMLIAAFASAAAAHSTHSPFLASLTGIAAALILATLHAFLCINLRADQVISGFVVNLIAAGVPPVLCKAFYDASGGTPMLEASDRLAPLLGISPLALASVALVIALWLVHRHTLFGQYLRFAGEHPNALASQGISPKKIRWLGVLLSGVFCGLAGTYLAIDHGSGFSRNMTSGRGFIALAALILGRWNPVGAFFAAFAFGAIEASQILLQGIPLPNGQTVPVQWIQMIPYIATLVLLAGFMGNKRKMRPPKALGTAAQLSIAILVTLTLSGCTVPDEVLKTFNEKIGPHLGLKIYRDLGATKEPNAASDEPPPPSDEHRRVNGEFLKEVFQVVLKRELNGEEEFLKYMNILDQGGHYEGIYNGLVYSEEYKAKEKGNASVSALKAYSEVAAQIALDRKYDPLRIKKPDKPDVPNTQELQPPQPTAAERQSLIAQYEKEALLLSPFALKRRLGEDLLKTVDLKKEYREKLATWYGRLSVFLNKMGVDYGVEQRNSVDEYYHYKWALDAEEDRLKWECLNRIHRLINTKAN